MQKKTIIPITDKKINKLYKLWLENGFEKEEKIDITKPLLRGSEKDINQINLYSTEKDQLILSTVVLIFQIDNPSISGIGEVCTELNSRGNKFAYNLCKLARDDFFSIDNSQCNFLGTINPLAAKIYKKLGWKKLTFHKLVDYTCNLVLENDPMKIYVDVLNDDTYKIEIFSELGFIETSSYSYTFDRKIKKLCNRMVLRI